MNLPKVISELVKAQNSHDSLAYANCFTETGTMYDEGKIHTGRSDIQQWIAKSNEKYQTVMKPIAFHENDMSNVMSAEISGTFEGSLIVLEFHFDIREELIETLRVSG